MQTLKVTDPANVSGRPITLTARPDAASVELENIDTQYMDSQYRDGKSLEVDSLDEGIPVNNDATHSSSDSARQYRDALGRFATGVTLVTTNSADGRVGMTVNSFASVSLEPALVLWSVNKKSGRYETFRDAQHFAIHVLAQCQTQEAMDFSRDAYAFDSDEWFTGENNVPLAKRALARFECVKEAVYDGGDHSIIVGRVVRFSQRQGSPLVFTAGEFGTFAARAEP